MLITGAMAAGALTACAPTSVLGQERCGSSPLEVIPAQAEPGASITLSSPAFECPTAYPDGTTYTFALSQDDRGGSLPLGAADVAEDGSFRTELVIPDDALPGDSYLFVTSGSVFDEPCDDGSCAAYGVNLTVLPATP